MFSVLAIIVLCQSVSTSQPEELLLAQSARTFGNGRVKWSVESFGEMAQVSQHSATFTSDGQYLLTNHFSHAGSTLRQKLLTYDGKTWLANDDSSLLAYAYDEHEPLFDIRSIGLAPLHEALSAGDALWGARRERNRQASFSVKKEGEHIVVESAWHNEKNQTRYQRWLNPHQGWSVSKTRLLRDDTLVAEVRCQYREWSGRWFPETVFYYKPDFENGDRPWRILSVEEATFNDPALPRVLIPPDIGVEPGTNILYRAKGSSKPEIMGWNGDEMENWHIFAGRIERGELKTGDRFDLQLRQVGPEPPTLALRRQKWSPDSWERYVLNFIAKYGLNTEQQQKAWSFHSDAKKLADQHVESHKAELEAIAAGRAPVTLEPKRSEGESEAAFRFKTRLHDIFEQKLSSRLEKLPTRKQRETAVKVHVP